ncbi:MAG: hypothetical protein AAFR61_18825 [Bacteroidota bacterium]
MRFITIISFLLVLIPWDGFAKEFYFLGMEDRHYENPANWYPAYPGSKIAKGDKVVIMADVNFGFYDISVGGIMEIAMNAQMHSPQGKIMIQPEGLLDNNGQLMVEIVENNGQFFNRIAATSHLHTYVAHPGAHTYNGYSAIFRTIGPLVNGGRFDNYSACISGSDFTNTATFHQVRQSRLTVAGDMFLSPDCTFTQSADSRIYHGRVEKLIVEPQLPGGTDDR